MDAPASSSTRPRRRLGLALFVAAFCAYMLSTSREVPWNDAKPVHQVAESLVFHGRFDVPTRWPYTAKPGRDGKWQSTAPILPSLIHVPGAIVQRLATARAPEHAVLARAITCHLGPAAMGALACLLFFCACLRLGVQLPAAGATTLLLALGSSVWVYARSPFSEATQIACFAGFFAQVLTCSRRPTRTAALALGLWAGALVNTKLAHVVALPGAALLLVWHLRGDRRALVQTAAAALLGLLPGIVVTLLWNWLRWGSMTRTGYELAEQSVFRERLLWGLWGMFLSPGKSLFLYSPPLVLALVAVPRVLRRAPTLLAAIVLVAGPILALHAKLLWWSGDWAWGPRYAIVVLPALLLPAAFLIDDLFAGRRRVALAAVAAVGMAGAAVQVIGSSFYWDNYIRIAQQARGRWLGVPNRQGAVPWNHAHACDPCFEDLNPFIWLPPFQPIEGHVWLARHLGRGDDWVTAEKDAAWKRYTRLPLDIADSYQRARFDWWWLDWQGPRRAGGLMLFALWGAGLVLALVVYARASYRAGQGRAP